MNKRQQAAMQAKIKETVERHLGLEPREAVVVARLATLASESTVDQAVVENVSELYSGLYRMIGSKEIGAIARGEINRLGLGKDEDNLVNLVNKVLRLALSSHREKLVAGTNITIRSTKRRTIAAVREEVQLIRTNYKLEQKMSWPPRRRVKGALKALDEVMGALSLVEKTKVFENE